MNEIILPIRKEKWLMISSKKGIFKVVKVKSNRYLLLILPIWNQHQRVNFHSSIWDYHKPSWWKLVGLNLALNSFTNDTYNKRLNHWNFTAVSWFHITLGAPRKLDRIAQFFNGLHILIFWYSYYLKIKKVFLSLMVDISAIKRSNKIPL